MSAQPLNNDIKVFRSIRAQRQMSRTDSIGAITKGLRPQVMSIPGQHIQVQYLGRNASHADFSPYMGEASLSATRGFPTVVGLRKQVSLSNAEGNLPGIGFSFSVGRDTFITNSEAGLDRDLHKDARALVADVA